MSTIASDSRSARTFFTLVFAVSTPFWVLGARSSQRLAANLSLGSLMIIAPFAVAVLLTFREEGTGGARQLLQRAVDIRRLRGKTWYLPIFLLMPVLMTACCRSLSSRGHRARQDGMIAR